MCCWFGRHCARDLHHCELIVESHKVGLSVTFHRSKLPSEVVIHKGRVLSSPIIITEHFTPEIHRPSFFSNNFGVLNEVISVSLHQMFALLMIVTHSVGGDNLLETFTHRP